MTNAKKQYFTGSVRETKKLARSLAPLILKKRPKNQALIIALKGELGSGKTTFTQGLAKALKIKQNILSPTFVIYKKFEIRYLKSNIQYLIHIDCYRIKNPKEILDLGFKELSSNSQNIVVIEWADKIKKILPKDTIWINFKFIDQKTRKIDIRAYFDSIKLYE